jgi:hypothetical protein
VIPQQKKSFSKQHEECNWIIRHKNHLVESFLGRLLEGALEDLAGTGGRKNDHVKLFDKSIKTELRVVPIFEKADTSRDRLSFEADFEVQASDGVDAGGRVVAGQVDLMGGTKDEAGLDVFGEKSVFVVIERLEGRTPAVTGPRRGPVHGYDWIESDHEVWSEGGEHQKSSSHVIYGHWGIESLTQAN